MLIGNLKPTCYNFNISFLMIYSPLKTSFFYLSSLTLSVCAALTLSGCELSNNTPSQVNTDAIKPIAAQQTTDSQTKQQNQNTSPSYQSFSCIDQFYQQSPPVIRNKTTKHIYPICHDDFAVMYSGEKRVSLWVAQKLTKARVSQSLKREDSFKEYTHGIPTEHQAKLSDYKGSGYDRGHMAPNAHMGTKSSQSDSFYLTNMVPQTPNSNQNDWREIEEAVRKMVRNTNRDTYVITGPAFLNNKNNPEKFIPCDKIDRNDKNEQPAKQCSQPAKNRIQVPTHTYKAVYFTSPKGTPFISAYFVENDRDPKVEVMSVCELEKKIGIYLFPELDDETKKLVYDMPLSAGKVTTQPPKKLQSYTGKCLPALDPARIQTEKTKFQQ